MGYNQNWIAIAMNCFPMGGVGTPGTDQLVLIPSNVLTQSPPPQSLGQIQKADAFFNALPSRDISGLAHEHLFLVAPMVTASALPFVQVTSIDANGNFIGPGSGSGPAVSPGNGVMRAGGLFAPAQHDSCASGACRVDLSDDRIHSVVVQTANDGKRYLLTSFHAGDPANNL